MQQRKKIESLLLETGSKIWKLYKIWTMMEPMSERWHWTHYFLPVSPWSLSPVEKGNARCSHVQQERTASAGQDSLTPPAPAGRLLMVCQSSLKNCSGNFGELKQRIDLNVYLRGLPAGGKWVVVKQEKWGVKKKLHIIKLRSLQNEVSETWELLIASWV